MCVSWISTAVSLGCGHPKAGAGLGILLPSLFRWLLTGGVSSSPHAALNLRERASECLKQKAHALFKLIWKRHPVTSAVFYSLEVNRSPAHIQRTGITQTCENQEAAIIWAIFEPDNHIILESFSISGELSVGRNKAYTLYRLHFN